MREGGLDLKLFPDAKPYQTNKIQHLNYHEREATDRELQKLTDSKVLRKCDQKDLVQCTQWPIVTYRNGLIVLYITKNHCFF